MAAAAAPTLSPPSMAMAGQTLGLPSDYVTSTPRKNGGGGYQWPRLPMLVGRNYWMSLGLGPRQGSCRVGLKVVGWAGANDGIGLKLQVPVGRGWAWGGAGMAAEGWVAEGWRRRKES